MSKNKDERDKITVNILFEGEDFQQLKKLMDYWGISTGHWTFVRKIFILFSQNSINDKAELYILRKNK